MQVHQVKKESRHAYNESMRQKPISTPPNEGPTVTTLLSKYWPSGVHTTSTMYISTYIENVK